jgi:hypothetical protein
MRFSPVQAETFRIFACVVALWLLLPVPQSRGINVFMSKFLAPHWDRLRAASGLVSSGPGMGGADIEGGPGAVVVIALLGAFAGLLAGLMVSHLVRFLAMTSNRNFGGLSWVIYGAIVGAITFALLAINSDTN